MSSIKSAGLSDEKFRPWLRRELIHATKLGLSLFAGVLALSWILTAASQSFALHWSAFNYRLSSVALDQHPLALARTFATRLRESEYGWRPLSARAPFNVTDARAALRRDFPEVASVINGEPRVPRAMALRNQNPERYQQRIDDYMARYRRIESGRFTKLYDRDDMFSPPNANVKLGIFATKLFGLIDAFVYTVGTIIAGGFAGIFLFATVLALSAVPLWRSRRPARTWLKAFVWPGLASTLVWGAILFMAIGSALFGEWTVNTSALALALAIPFLSLLAKLPLHLAETLVNRAPPPPKKWDGVERRKPRPPEPPPGMTVPPIGGA